MLFRSITGSVDYRAHTIDLDHCEFAPGKALVLECRVVFWGGVLSVRPLSVKKITMLQHSLVLDLPSADQLRL